MDSHRATAGKGRLAGKCILVTGPAGSQGSAAQRALCQGGAVVVGCDVIEGGAEQLAAELAERGYRAYGRRVDLSDDCAARRWVVWGVETIGGLDVLYNNAAATNFAPCEHMTKALWEYVIRNELDSTFYVTLAAWPHLTEQGGLIINLSSVSPLVSTGSIRAHCRQGPVGGRRASQYTGQLHLARGHRHTCHLC